MSLPTINRRHHARKWSHGDWRPDLIAAAGEFIGTFTFLLLGLGGIQAARAASVTQGVNGAQQEDQQVTVADPSFLLMAATSMGMSLVFSIWVFFRVTGAAFNPNIAFTLVLLGAITPFRFVLYVFAQLLGAIAAAGVLQGLLPGELNVNCAPGNGIGIAQALFYEMFLTFALCITVIMVAVEKNKSTPFSPLAIGFALFATQLAGIQFTGAAVNTARAFGPAVATRTFDGAHWIYWVGPSLGAILAAGLHASFHLVHYWELNPNADATAPVAPPKPTEPKIGEPAV